MLQAWSSSIRAPRAAEPVPPKRRRRLSGESAEQGRAAKYLLQRGKVLIAIGQELRTLDHNETVIERGMTGGATGAQLVESNRKCGAILAVDRLFELAHRLADVLAPHLDHEEQVLFPLLAECSALSSGIAAQLEDMRRDHLQLATLLERIRDASDEFRVPEWGCRRYRELASDLAGLDGDLRAHIHLENHILLPRFLGAER